MTTSLEVLEPIFNDNYVAIAANSSNEYVPYLSVYLESIKNQSSNDTNYDVVILECSITDENKAILKETFETQPNLSLRFYNPLNLFINSQLEVSHFYLCKESYFRLGAPIIFKNYKKLIFTDVDLMFNNNPKELYDIEMNNAPILAVLEPIWSIWINNNKTINNINIKEYTDKILKLKNPYRYFNTGVMLMDIDKINNDNIGEILLSKLSTGTKYLYQDQDVLNEVLSTQMGILPFEWNCEILDKRLNGAEEFIKDYCNFEKRNIIHWIGSEKPWINKEREHSYKWWKLARKSAYYEVIFEQSLFQKFQQKINLLEEKYTNLHRENLLLQNQKYNELMQADNQIKDKLSEMIFHIANYRKYTISYWRYKLLSKILPGKKRKHYIEKKKFYKNKINIVKQIREGKYV